MPAQFVPMVETVGIGAQEPAHSSHQIAIGRFNHQVEMIPHQTIAVNLEPGLLASLGQGLEKFMAIPVIQEDRIFAVPSAQDVIDRSGIFNSQWTRHDQNPALARLDPQAQKWTKLRFDPFTKLRFDPFTFTLKDEVNHGFHGFHG
jgi:hypothetical protein